MTNLQRDRQVEARDERLDDDRDNNLVPPKLVTEEEDRDKERHNPFGEYVQPEHNGFIERLVCDLESNNVKFTLVSQVSQVACIQKIT